MGRYWDHVNPLSQDNERTLELETSLSQDSEGTLEMETSPNQDVEERPRRNRVPNSNIFNKQFVVYQAAQCECSDPVWEDLQFGKPSILHIPMIGYVQRMTKLRHMLKIELGHFQTYLQDKRISNPSGSSKQNLILMEFLNMQSSISC